MGNTGYRILDKRTWASIDDDQKDSIISDLKIELNRGKYSNKLSFHNNEIMLHCKEYYIVNRKYNADLLYYFNK